MDQVLILCFEKEAGQRQNRTIQNQILFNCETQLTSRHDILTTSGNLKGYGRAKRKQTHPLSQHCKTAWPGEVEGPWQHTSSGLSVHLHSVGPVILCDSRGKPRDWGEVTRKCITKGTRWVVPKKCTKCHMFTLQRKYWNAQISLSLKMSEVKFYHGIIYLYIVFLPLSRRVRANLVAKRGKKGNRSKGKISGNKRKAKKKDPKRAKRDTSEQKRTSARAKGRKRYGPKRKKRKRSHM